MSDELIHFENFDNYLEPSFYISSANAIINDGWACGNHPVLTLKTPFSWELKSVNHSSWNFHIHSFDMFNSLLMAYDMTKNVEYLEICRPVLLEWINLYGNASGNYSCHAWYDMAAGKRAYRIAYFLDAASRCAENIIDEKERALIWNALLAHDEYLADDNNISFHSNHGYYQIAGQLAMGRRFMGASDVMRRAYRQALERFDKILNLQFSPDGIHKEHSPDYHRMVYGTLKALYDSGLVTGQRHIDFAEKIEAALSWFVLPSGYMANFGDSQYSSVVCPAESALKMWNTPAMRHAASGGAVGEKPEGALMLFREGGYAVHKRHDQGCGHAYLAVQAGFHSRTHKHADDLTFIWSERGSDIIVDAGRYGYIGKSEKDSELWNSGYWYTDPRRNYCESTRAHNTLEFDGRDYPRKGAEPYGSALEGCCEDPCGLVGMAASCVHFKSVRRGRMLLHYPGCWLLVLDCFQDAWYKRHEVKQWFHLAPELRAVKEGDTYTVGVAGSNQPLRVACLSRSAHASPVYNGVGEPRLQGWTSRKDLEFSENDAFCFAMRNKSGGSFVTLLSFSESLITSHEAKIKPSGKKGKIAWHDDRGRHAIQFERSAKDDIFVRYVLNDTTMTKTA